MAKIRKAFRLEDATIKYVDQIKEAYALSDATKALEKIIEEHRNKDLVNATDDFCKKLSKEVALLLNKPLTRIRLGVNNADRNSEVILLLLNALISYTGYQSLPTQETLQLTAAKNEVAERINVFRKKKLEREKRKKEKAKPLPDIEEIDWGDVDANGNNGL